MFAELSGQDLAEAASGQEPVVPETQVEPELRVVGAVLVPHWRDGLTTDVLPDVYPSIVDIGDRPCQHRPQSRPRSGAKGLATRAARPFDGLGLRRFIHFERFGVATESCERY
ncbi:hypothetical protein [Streptomyces camelliae]|uniref:Uncharacterized protein n=1 Tax=Streptomyces camelliae TaxID=3004093 RepID=A0ABY7NZU9_9ACTN|nr:hypothetical protein [Streptomyces sp. HUAS 2-6]WBO61548.1 hypothetical protein O1G22_01015 [Streptomyces sp. HUAS 2-6]